MYVVFTLSLSNIIREYWPKNYYTFKNNFSECLLDDWVSIQIRQIKLALNLIQNWNNLLY